MVNQFRQGVSKANFGRVFLGAPAVRRGPRANSTRSSREDRSRVPTLVGESSQPKTWLEIVDPSKRYIFLAWLVENKGTTKKQKEKGELILGKKTGGRALGDLDKNSATCKKQLIYILAFTKLSCPFSDPPKEKFNFCWAQFGRPPRKTPRSEKVKEPDGWEPPSKPKFGDSPIDFSRTGFGALQEAGFKAVAHAGGINHLLHLTPKRGQSGVQTNKHT